MLGADCAIEATDSKERQTVEMIRDPVTTVIILQIFRGGQVRATTPENTLEFWSGYVDNQPTKGGE